MYSQLNGHPNGPQAQAGWVLEAGGIPLEGQATERMPSVNATFLQPILIAGTPILESSSTNNKNHTRLFS